jgi:hypothetical protein
VIEVVDVGEVCRLSRCSRPSRGTGGTSTRLELRYRPVFLPEAAREVDANVPPNPRLLAGPQAASFVVVLSLAERPSLPHGVGRVDTAGSSNGVVKKNGRRQRTFKRLGHKPLRRRTSAHAAEGEARH